MHRSDKPFAFVCYGLAIAIVLCSAAVITVSTLYAHPPETMTNGKPYNRNNSDSEGNAMGGLSSSRGFSIQWRTPSPSDPQELEVLKAVAQRFQFVQKSPQASDTRARALIQVLEAIDALQGTSEVSTPIGESGFLDGAAPSSPSDKKE